MKKVVLKLDLHDGKCRQKALKIASGLSGVDSVSMDKDQKLTVTGDIDPVTAVKKLKKLCCTELVSVGPKEAEKKPEPKKPEPKKEEPKKATEPKKEEPVVWYYHPMPTYYCPPLPDCYCKCAYENPASCVIC